MGLLFYYLYNRISYYFLCVLFVGKIGFCHMLCWMAPFMVIGKKLSKEINISKLTLIVKPNECISCKRCTNTCSMGLDVMNIVKKGKFDSTECILCGKCVNTCPKDIIKYNFGKRNIIFVLLIII